MCEGDSACHLFLIHAVAWTLRLIPDGVSVCVNVCVCVQTVFKAG